MKYAKFALGVKVAALVLAGGVCGTASAEIVEGRSLGAWDVVNQFNGMNGGAGLRFSFVEDHANVSSKVYNANDNYEFADIGAYANSTIEHFNTLRASPSLTYNNDKAGGQGTGKLSYDGSASWTGYPGTSKNNATLSVGAAYISKMYATEWQYYIPHKAGDSEPYVTFLRDWTYLGNRDVIRLDTESRGGLAAWDNSSPYLQSLLALNNDKNYWLAAYDPDKYYTEIGDYSVFVMNTYRLDGSAMGNMLYVADMRPAPVPGVPEPETWAMLLAGLSLVGVVARRRNALR